MTSHGLVRIALAAVLLAATAPAVAMNCYAVVDRNDHIVYQSTRSPIDLSDAGTAARDKLRANGEQLIAMNARTCPEVETSSIGGEHKPATVAEIVAGMRPALRYGRPASAEASEMTSTGGIDLPRIAQPVATDGGVSTSGIPSGMSLR